MANIATNTMTKEEQVAELLELRATLVDMYNQNFAEEKNPVPFQQIKLPIDNEEQDLFEQMTLHL